jgi:spore coat protein CotH
VRRAAALAALAFLCACGGGTPSEPNIPVAQPTATPAPSAPPGAPIFDPTVLHEATLELDRSAWQALRDHYLSNQYYAANFSVDGVPVPQVGIRSRGSGSRNEEKPALKVDFNKYVPGQEFYGYKSVDLKNLVQDPSMLRERLAFLVFEAMGFPAPRNAHARLTVNGEYWGLYALVEPVSKPFLEARLGDKEGNLFDYEWAFAYDFGWLGPKQSRYVPSPFQPQTHEDDPNVGAGLVSFIEAINDTPDATFVSAMSDRMDVDRFLFHVAIENALAEDDGIVGDFGANNFYLYEYASRNRFVFIPWDKDNTFRAASWPLYRNLDTNVLIRRLIADPAQRQLYAAAVWRTVNGFLNSRWLGPQLETAYQQIRAAALADPRKKWTNEQFEGGVAGLRAVVDARESDVGAQR